MVFWNRRRIKTKTAGRWRLVKKGRGRRKIQQVNQFLFSAFESAEKELSKEAGEANVRGGIYFREPAQTTTRRGGIKRL